MMYVTYRGIETTVKAMQTTKQITGRVAHDVLVLSTALKDGRSWKVVKGEIRKLVDTSTSEIVGEKIVRQIESDATIDTRMNKLHAFLP